LSDTIRMAAVECAGGIDDDVYRQHDDDLRQASADRIEKAIRAEAENLRRALCVVGAHFTGEPGYTRVRAEVAVGDALAGTPVEPDNRLLCGTDSQIVCTRCWPDRGTA
jgi:hypothetical protein